MLTCVQWDREFQFWISVTADNNYAIHKCEPQLPDHVLQQAMDEANKSNNFSGFVTTVRAAFKSTVV